MAHLCCSLHYAKVSFVEEASNQVSSDSSRRQKEAARYRTKFIICMEVERMYLDNKQIMYAIKNDIF